jgi:hypothetical protein
VLAGIRHLRSDDIDAAQRERKRRLAMIANRSGRADPAGRALRRRDY